MAADRPTIVATSGGYRNGRRNQLEFGPLVHHAVERAGVSGRTPRLCHVGTAGGDQEHLKGQVLEAGRAAGLDTTTLDLFSMPNVDDPRELVLAQDVVWVGGGSVANLLAVWRVHGLDAVFREAWLGGVVLGGVSAGSICWHVGGPTDSFGPDLRAVTDGLALLPFGNGVHYDAELQRRPLLQRLVGEGTLHLSYATDDGVGLVYEGTELVEAVGEVPGTATGGGAYRIEQSRDAGVVEERLPVRRLAG